MSFERLGAQPFRVAFAYMSPGCNFAPNGPRRRAAVTPRHPRLRSRTRRLWSQGLPAVRPHRVPLDSTAYRGDDLEVDVVVMSNEVLTQAFPDKHIIVEVHLRDQRLGAQCLDYTPPCVAVV